MKDIDYHLCHRMEIISNNCCILLSFLGLLAVSTYMYCLLMFLPRRGLILNLVLKAAVLLAPRTLATRWTLMIIIRYVMLVFLFVGISL